MTHVSAGANGGTASSPSITIEYGRAGGLAGSTNYSALIEILAKTPVGRRALLQNYFEPSQEEREAGIKTPTPAHRASARGFVRVIVTTNFDRLLESALRDEGVEPVVVSDADAMEGSAPVSHQRCLVVKLHRDTLDARSQGQGVGGVLNRLPIKNGTGRDCARRQGSGRL